MIATVDLIFKQQIKVGGILFLQLLRHINNPCLILPYFIPVIDPHCYKNSHDHMNNRTRIVEQLFGNTVSGK